MVSSNPSYQVRKCRQAACGLRYPCQSDYTFAERCPRCGAATDLLFVHMPGRGEPSTIGQPDRAMQWTLEALLDNVRSAWNVGSMFRSADGAGIRCLHLCGITPTPEFPGVLKTSLGAEKSVPWEQHLDGVQAAQSLVERDGARLWALENDERAGALYDIRLEIGVQIDGQKVVLVAGNEVSGVDPGILRLCERVLYLPMRGVKQSYNVAVAFGIAAHYLSWLAALPPAK